MSEKQVFELKEQSIILSFVKGQNIVSNQDQAQGVYSIRSGIIKLFLNATQSDNVTVGFRTAGDSIGYHDLIREANTFSATCVTNVEACFFPSKMVLQQSAKNPKLSKKFNSLLANDLHEISQCITNTFFKSIDQRVAAAILQIRNKVGVDENNCLAVPITRQDLADMVGARIESVFRALAFLKKKRLIEVTQQQVCILDEEKLFAFINKNTIADLA